jgi:hypothetical protein
MERMFDTFNSELEAASAKQSLIKEACQPIHAIVRRVQMLTLQVQSHADDADAAIADVCGKVAACFSELPAAWAAIAALIGDDTAPEKFRGLWRNQAQTLVFSAAYVHWLKSTASSSTAAAADATTTTGALLSHADAADVLGLAPVGGVDLEDYLTGLCLVGWCDCSCVTRFICVLYTLRTQISRNQYATHYSCPKSCPVSASTASPPATTA